MEVARRQKVASCFEQRRKYLPPAIKMLLGYTVLDTYVLHLRQNSYILGALSNYAYTPAIYRSKFLYNPFTP
jgi:hypothetical protein